jgi:hypothetical protein
LERACNNSSPPSQFDSRQRSLTVGPLVDGGRDYTGQHAFVELSGIILNQKSRIVGPIPKTKSIENNL